MNKEKVLDVLAYIIAGIKWIIAIGLGLLVIYTIGELLITELSSIEFNFNWKSTFEFLKQIGLAMLAMFLMIFVVAIFSFSDDRIRKIKEKKADDEFLDAFKKTVEDWERE